jgi:hypothetical protein
VFFDRFGVVYPWFFLDFLCHFYAISILFAVQPPGIPTLPSERMMEAAWGARARGRPECGSSY